MIIKVFEMTAGKTGLTERDAAAEGYDFDTVIVPGNDSAGYYPGFREIVTKLIYERKNGRILGGQVFGWGVVDKPVDILVTAISFNATIFDLAHLDLAYAPPFSNAMASTIASSNTAKNRMSQRVKTIHPFELYSRWEKNELTVLDVRTDEEVEEWSIERSLHIENTYLPDRLGELDKNRKYAIVCKRGIRAYNAYRLLEAAGFRDLAVLAGGTVFSQPLIEMLKAGKPCGSKKL
jgi:rhodanese-related sulfurtransferase